MAVPKQTISHEELVAVLDYNPDTGEMKWRQDQTNWRHAKHFKDMGHVNDKGRRYVHINRKAYAAHRLAYFYVTKDWPTGNVAPLNGDYLDLRFSNLTVETPSETARRSADHSNNTSGLRGVSWDKSRNKWIVIFREGGRQYNLGRFDTKEEASEAFERKREEVLRIAPLSPMEMAHKREQARLSARYLALWKRTLRFAAGVTGWTDIKHFRADIGPDLRDRLSLAAIDIEKPIGPGNWKWDVTLFSQFDTSTRDGRNAYERAVRAKNPHLWRDREFRNKFGITYADYVAMLEAQDGVCAICSKPESRTREGNPTILAVDHCHATGAVRGLLCSNCNQGLGRFHDDVARLRKAAEYLERHATLKANGAAFPQLLEEDRTKHHDSSD